MPIIDKNGRELRKGDLVWIPARVIEFPRGPEDQLHQNLTVITEELHYPYKPRRHDADSTQKGFRTHGKTEISINSRQCEKETPEEPAELPAELPPQSFQG